MCFGYESCVIRESDIWVIADDSVGYYVQPTVILTKDPNSITMQEEIFGPVLTVSTVLLTFPCSVILTFGARIDLRLRR